MKTKHTILFAVGLFIALTSCKQKQAQPHTETKTEIIEQDSSTVQEDESEIEIDAKLNDTARFIAGMPVENKESKLYALSQTESWKQHSKNMDQIWSSFLQTAPKVMNFSQTELSEINEKYKTLFYPFGGPDFLFSNTFFPNMDTYFLIGLERTGNTPKVKHPSLATYHLYQNAVSDILNLSFFRTKDMKMELQNDTIDGVTPIICLLMARSERDIIRIEQKYLNEEGEIIPLENEEGTINAKNKLIEFTYCKKGSNKIQTLYYLSTDLSNGGLQGNRGLKAYIEKLERPTTACFIKSASYLMHVNYFSNIRNGILNHVSAIMQDDSGIPWKYYDQSIWNIKLYGSFYKPISMFAAYPQTDLRDSYQTANPKPINFRMGYARQSNLQLCTLKEEAE